MGGYGSGRRHQRGKETTSGMRALDVRRLQREGLLKPGSSFLWQWTRNGKETASIQIRAEENRLILNYRSRSHGGEWETMEYPVYLSWTGCNLGGRRAWFLCPARGCGRRVAILFGGAIFACRHCHMLVYECQRETRDNRAARRANTIRDRLGWTPGIFNGDGFKPKGMHWRTFWRLKAKHDDFVLASLVEMTEQIERAHRRLERIGIDIGNLDRDK